MKELLYILLGLILVSSCNNVDNKDVQYRTLDYYFMDADEIKGESLATEYVSSNIFRSFYTPYGFLGSMRSQDNKLVHLANLNTGEIMFSACPFGRGPEEILINSPDLAIHGNSLYLLDQRTDKLKKVEIQNDTLMTKELQKFALGEPMIFLEIQVISDSLYVIFAEDFNSVKKIMLIDKYNNIVDSVRYDLLEDEKVEPSKYRYNVEMELSPCKKYLYISSHLFSYVSKYIIEDNKIKLVKKIALVEPKYSVKDRTLLLHADNISLNNKIFVGDSYLYMKANPESVREEKARFDKAKTEGKVMEASPGNDSYILVFDYDLNLVKSYRVDSDVWHLTTTPDPSVVYALDYRENRLKRYILPYLR